MYMYIDQLHSLCLTSSDVNFSIPGRKTFLYPNRKSLSQLIAAKDVISLGVR